MVIVDDLVLQVVSYIDMLEQKVVFICSCVFIDYGMLYLVGFVEYFSLVVGLVFVNLFQVDKVNLVIYIGNKSNIYYLLENDVVEFVIMVFEFIDVMYEYQKLDKECLILVMNCVQGKLLGEREILVVLLN